LSQRLKRLARETKKRAIILPQHPLVTSARKVDLYSRREHMRFLVRAICGGRRTAKSRTACYIWYDGRR
jgi:hypothetical protein